MAAQGGKIGRAGHQARMLLFCILSSTCYHLNLICSQESALDKESPARDKEVPSPEVAPQPDKVVDPLQPEVDTKLLVSSNGMGRTARRQVPTQKALRAKINVQNIIFVHVLGVSMLSLCVHLHSVQKPSLSQPNPLKCEHAGGKKSRSPSPAVDTSHRPPWRQCSQAHAAKK
jgi:hypothetical protein